MHVDIHQDKILILDFGSQYTQLIARRVREIGVYCEIHPFDWPDDKIAAFAPKGIILSGGPNSVTEVGSPRASAAVFSESCPVLGICYGMQTMAVQLGGEVVSHDQREFGYAQVAVHGHTPLLQNIEDHVVDEQSLLDVWMSHGDRVTRLPDGFSVTAATDSLPIAGMANQAKQLYGLQFHPEVTHTRQGTRILQRFVCELCGCQTRWTPKHIIADSIEKIRQAVGNDQVVLGLSGGVDSSVVAALLQAAIGDQLTCVFVDNGLLRQHEAEQVMTMFEQHQGIRVIHVDASERFLTALQGVSDPEAKRKIIGRAFIDVFDAEAKKIPNAVWLAQGTIYPDVIESAAGATGKATVIKSHHNVGGLPETMKLKLLEPLRELFKDEVRKIGLELGLPYEQVFRHPFPGPGLAVRILGEVTPEFIALLKPVDAIFIQALRDYDLYDSVSQAFAVFLPVKSVGVIGDARQYNYVVALRAVETIDFMTAHWARLPYELLDEVSHKIINEVAGVSRVVYDISGKPPATIEWE